MISLLVGLGNIGERYRETRHNVGMEILDKVAITLKAQPRPLTGLYDWSIARREEKDLTLAWPRTYMNRSGLAVRALLNTTGLSPEQMLVIVDDFNLPLGRLRLRKSGSDGGHNGLGSIIEAIGTEEFPRLRVGIGPVPEDENTIDFVLGRFKPDELKLKQKVLEISSEAVLFTLNHRFDIAMSKYNVNPV